MVLKQKQGPRQSKRAAPRTGNIALFILGVALLISAVLPFYHAVVTATFDCHSSSSNSVTISHDVPHKRSSQGSSVSTATALAFQQSLGFFHDISNDSWQRLRQTAHEAHSFTSTTTTSTIAEAELERQNHDNPTVWYLNSLEPDFTCPDTTRVGGLDGNSAMWTCNVHRLVDQQQQQCLIYSFGSDGNYTWEDGLIDELASTRCEIHVFEEQNHARAGDELLKNIHFHQWGLESSYHAAFNANLVRSEHGRGNTNNDGAVRFTFAEILSKLGHENRTIDILRMASNVDKVEWTTYKDWVKADVRQILLATHGAPFFAGTPNGMSLQFQASNLFASFTAHGFAMFSKDTVNTGFDFGFVKLHDDFWKSNEKNGTITDVRHQRQIFLPQLALPERNTTVNRIPRNIIYAHESNILDVEAPTESFFTAWHSVQKYRKAWNMSTADLVWFVDDFTCLAALYEHMPELMQHYWLEKTPSRKQDICGLLALYLTGGYYLHFDFAVRLPYTAPNDIGLVLALDEQGRLSREFIASEPMSSVVKSVLDNMLDAYKSNKTGNVDFDLGAEALSASVESSLSATVQAAYVQLREIGGVPQPWIAPIPSAELFVNAIHTIPESMRGPPPADAKIPQRLLFTYKDNMLETKEPAVLYKNVLNTIDVYRKAWDEPDAPVWFLDDDDCRSAIYTAKPGLVSYFDREPEGAFKADICRVAALYLTGGYYFDVDMEAVNAWMPARNVSFATATEPGKKRYFQSFMASEPKNKILEEALDEMLLFYENGKLRSKAFGPETLKWAFDSVPPSEVGETVILEEVAFKAKDSLSQQRREAVGCCCHYKVQTPDTHETIFYSRVVDGSPKCVGPNPLV